MGLSRFVSIAAVWAAGVSIALAAPVFVVNNALDAPAAAPLDSGPCETAPGNGICTLRAAIMKANHAPGGNATVRFGLPGNVVYTLTIPGPGFDDETIGDLNITAPMTIAGNGIAQTIIDGNGNAPDRRALTVNVPTGTQVHIVGVTIRNASGCGLRNFGTLFVNESSISDNKNCAADGAGIASYGPLTLVRSLVRGNTSSGGFKGGGVWNADVFTMIASTIRDNVAGGATSRGGGIYSGDNPIVRAEIVNSTIVNNRAALGGGLHTDHSGFRFVTSTVSQNFGEANGGGIYVGPSGSGFAFSSTIADNRANGDGVGPGSGGGVFVSAGESFNVSNSIVANNSRLIDQGAGQPVLVEPDDCAGAVGLNTLSLFSISDPARCTITGAPIIADPKLGSLADNGGPTLTYALQPGSPAIDAAPAGNCTSFGDALAGIDQRGVSRLPPPGSGCDLGAYEVGGIALLDVDASAPVSKYDALTDGLLVLRTLFGLTGTAMTNGAIAPGAHRGTPDIAQYLAIARYWFDVDGDGTVDALTDGLLILRYLFGLNGASLVQSAVSANATRSTSADIQAYLATLAP